MGYIKPKKRALGDIKVIDPKPVWEVTIQKEGKPEYKLYAGTEQADKYFKAGHKVKLITTAGELRQYE